MPRTYLLLICCCLFFSALLLAGCLPGAAPAALTAGPKEYSLSRPDGALVAQVRAVGPGSLVSLSTPAGQTVATLNLPGQIAFQSWHPGGDLLIVTTTLKDYTFGTNYQLQLHRWDGKTEPRSRILCDTTLKPLTLARWKTQLHALPKPALSPQGDVLVFLRLHDPPAFDPYLKVTLFHLEGPGELVLGSQGMPGTTPSFSVDGEVVSWQPAGEQAVQVQPWLGGEVEAGAGVRETASIDPVLLELRRLLIQGLLSPEDYRRQWLQRRQP